MSAVREFERAFADYVGARHAIALCNGTATLHTALLALGVKPGDRVAVPPLTMSSTTLAVLHAGAVPVFVDVDPQTWIIDDDIPWPDSKSTVGVSLYGLHLPTSQFSPPLVDDAAQTLRPHGEAAFTSYSFQASKILALGEGGMLTTNDPGLAEAARSYSSLGYPMGPDSPVIDKADLKVPGYARHYRVGWNYRMNAITAARGREFVARRDGRRMADWCLGWRREAAALYAEAIAGCDWLTPQRVPAGWGHDYWAYAVAVGQSASFATNIAHLTMLQDLIVQHGGERPYPAWRLAYREPALKHLDPDAMHYPPGHRPTRCPVAEDLQPRLLQFQTNDLAGAERNAAALRRAIAEVEG